MHLVRVVIPAHVQLRGLQRLSRAPEITTGGQPKAPLLDNSMINHSGVTAAQLNPQISAPCGSWTFPGNQHARWKFPLFKNQDYYQIRIEKIVTLLKVI